MKLLPFVFLAISAVRAAENAELVGPYAQCKAFPDLRERYPLTGIDTVVKAVELVMVET